MSETVRLIAAGPGTQFYGTRALVAGDQFEMPRQYADVLILLGKARLADEKPTPAPQRHEPATSHSHDLNELRAEAHRIGLIWDGRWGAERLHEEIMRAKHK